MYFVLILGELIAVPGEVVFDLEKLIVPHMYSSLCFAFVPGDLVLAHGKNSFGSGDLVYNPGKKAYGPRDLPCNLGENCHPCLFFSCSCNTY